MSKFPDPPVNTEFSEKGQSSPGDPWEKWLIAVGNGLTNAPQGTNATRAQRLKLLPANISIGSMFFESDTGHVLAWSGKAWIQLV